MSQLIRHCFMLWRTVPQSIMLPSARNVVMCCQCLGNQLLTEGIAACQKPSNCNFSKGQNELELQDILREIQADFNHEYKKKDDVTDKKESTKSPSKDGKTKIPRSVIDKYKVFKDDDQSVILDVDEERQLRESSSLFPKEEPLQPTFDQFSGINLKRGETGVFDIVNLVDVLREENCQDLCVIRVPPDLKYVDFMVTVTGNSPRHMLATAEFVRKLYKKKRRQNDLLPRIEGKDSHEWIALDLGNIALHIFNSATRKHYDLETLWSVGYHYDDKANAPEDPVLAMLDHDITEFVPVTETHKKAS